MDKFFLCSLNFRLCGKSMSKYGKTLFIGGGGGGGEGAGGFEFLEKY